MLTLVVNMSTAQEQNYLKTYFPHINSAELAIIEDNYYQALKSFEKAFENTKDGHLKDYFNAAVCATYLGDANLTYKFLEKVGGKGLSLDFVKNEVAFKAIQRDPDWRNFELKYLEAKRQFEKSQNQKLKEVLRILKSRTDWFELKSVETFADTLRLLQNDNAYRLDSLIGLYGFPGENEIGIGDKGYPVITYPFYDIIKSQTPNEQFINFSNHIITGVRQGRLTPQMASYLLRFINDDDIYFSRFVYQIKLDESISNLDMKHGDKANKWVHSDLSAEDERRFDELRLDFGLDKMSDYRRKVLFSIEDHRFLLPYKFFASLWFLRDANLADEYLDNTVLATIKE